MSAHSGNLSPLDYREPTLASFAARGPGLELGVRGGGGLARNSRCPSAGACGRRPVPRRVTPPRANGGGGRTAGPAASGEIAGWRKPLPHFLYGHGGSHPAPPLVSGTGCSPSSRGEAVRGCDRRVGGNAVCTGGTPSKGRYAWAPTPTSTRVAGQARPLRHLVGHRATSARGPGSSPQCES